MNKLAVLALAAAFAVSSTPTAIERFIELNQQAHAARQSGDKAAYLASALKMEALLNHSPEAVEAVARAYEASEDHDHALDALEQYAALGQTDQDILNGKNKAFESLKGLPRFQSILSRMAANSSDVDGAQTAFMIADAGLLPEDIDYDAQARSFLVTSILEKKIVRIAFDGKAMAFASSPSQWPILALKIDPSRNLVWATEVALNGFTSVARNEWGRSAVLCFDVKTGKLLRRIEGPAHSALGDMVLAPNGDPIVSDGDGGGVYRVTASGLTRIDSGDFISPQTPAILPGEDRIAVPDYLRGIGILDPGSGHVSWIEQNGEHPAALNGIDGLYLQGDSMLLTQNGTSPERVVRLRLDRGFTRVRSVEIVERATRTLGDPTHGVVVGNTFYYIANSGWNQLDDRGEIKPGASLTPARIMRYRLR